MVTRGWCIQPLPNNEYYIFCKNLSFPPRLASLYDVKCVPCWCYGDSWWYLPHHPEQPLAVERAATITPVFSFSSWVFGHLNKLQNDFESKSLLWIVDAFFWWIYMSPIAYLYSFVMEFSVISIQTILLLSVSFWIRRAGWSLTFLPGSALKSVPELSEEA